MKIKNKEIGSGRPCFIIAEAGVNHNGNMGLAEKMIYAAAKAGADAIKFQTFKAEQVTTKDSPTADYQKKNVGENNQWSLLHTLELKEEAYPRLIETCKKAGIMFMSTPHGHINSAKFLEPLVELWKVGSGDLTNLPFLKFLGKTNKPIILSTGMATIKEIKEAVETIETTGNRNLIILQCTTNYPCPDNEANVGAILDIKAHFPDYLVGFSDHTIGINADILAASLGAVVIEKHFTLDKNMPGPDQKNSADPQELTALVKRVKHSKIEVKRIPNRIELMGSGKKFPLPNELVIAQMTRKAVIAKSNIPAGTKITEEMLTIKRPAKSGLHPRELENIIGRMAKKDIQADTQVQATDF
ncbi:MAG: N-acetylneuraminate synthase family protein [Patescibacteria group bacterium]|nr:N-acetylneuraminate synthase family protein [Patescibacteria group bacterium]